MDDCEIIDNSFELMEDLDGEDLSDSEMLDISVEFLKYKSTVVIENLKELIPYNMTDSFGRTLLH